MDQSESSDSTQLLKTMTLEELDFESFSEQALLNLRKELLHLGADCEFQRVFIKDFGLNKIQFYLQDRNSEFQEFKFILKNCEVGSIDQFNNCNQTIQLERDYIFNEINGNQFSMVMFNEDTKQIQLCIYSAIQKILHCLEHNKKQFILNSEMQYQSMQHFQQTQCYDSLSQQDKQNYKLKYNFKVQPLLYCENITTYCFSFQNGDQFDDEEINDIERGEQVDYSKYFEFKIGNNQFEQINN
ncbi:hypothetical protein TTHERM_001027579 (macronuclear) [Tetrahymena thermophila SB210]|uniref:Uncharacterized protein n=1 Tax=Tetrahymena thermophila (strain SB210) TaxID=312017 RepID=W7X655_TETTS|nr:hypothetical protein TTHERM_001027579 [Tetrahymena thermophila SB210]EWS72882.1 hypothetical protein TTHERM_001027579 [Tetrahymena thermophila SB210]|eukprot:XP_012654579.1 hypothetical protein TTHERM_001027579 [Tetrahymena thermophila SB210]